MRMYWSLAVLGLAVLGGVCVAQNGVAGAKAGVKTDMGIYHPPAELKLPKAGETFVDPTFGTTIMRVTDERDGKSNHLSYSYYPSFNKDCTRLMLCSDN